MEQDNQITEQNPQEPATVGMFLKYTRQNQKKSIENVSKALCIRKIYIKAIEESDFNELPPVPYGIGFIRSYADYLGLNAERIVQCYKEESMPRKNDNVSKPIVKKHTALTMPDFKQILVGICLVLVLYFLVLAFGYDYFKTKSDIIDDNLMGESLNTSVEQSDGPVHNSDTLVEEQVTLAVEQEDTVVMIEENYVDPEVESQIESVIETEPTAESIIETNLKPVEQKNKIVVKFNGESWFEVKDDRQVYISGIYQKGFEYEIPDVPNLIFSVGRYFNVDVFINDKLVKVAGPKKQTNIKLDEFLNH
ncbi:MAG: DUF4115 domain-containing protein [Alphaproteobacteria bacterium]|nr:DUF4115 domain-containing protein [Alphaproteobacteria bacterium]